MARMWWLGIGVLAVGCADARVDELLAQQASLEEQVASLSDRVETLGASVERVSETRRRRGVEPGSADWVQIGDDGVRTLVMAQAPAGWEWRRLARLRPADEGLGMKVLRVSEDSALWRLGFQNGDVLLAINGVDASGIDMEGLAASVLQPGEVRLSFDRFGVEKNVTIQVQ